MSYFFLFYEIDGFEDPTQLVILVPIAVMVVLALMKIREQFLRNCHGLKN
jgi:hypothetical protein